MKWRIRVLWNTGVEIVPKRGRATKNCKERREQWTKISGEQSKRGKGS